MPMKSGKQRKFLWATNPKLAKEFESKTPDGIKLPGTLAGAIKKAKKSIGWKSLKKVK